MHLALILYPEKGHSCGAGSPGFTFLEVEWRSKGQHSSKRGWGLHMNNSPIPPQNFRELRGLCSSLHGRAPTHPSEGQAQRMHRKEIREESLPRPPTPTPKQTPAVPTQFPGSCSPCV